MTTFIKITDENEELMHVGVMGMRWGHRKSIAPTLQKIGSFKPIRSIGNAGKKTADSVKAINKKAAVKNPEREVKRQKLKRNGATIATALIASNLGSAAAFKLTGSPTVAFGAGIAAAYTAGTKVYDAMGD